MTRGRGGCSFESLRPPVTSGSAPFAEPSKPCHIWVDRVGRAFKTLSHLGFYPVPSPSKPCHIWAENRSRAFKTLSHLGTIIFLKPSKPCHIWEFVDAVTFKTLSHLGWRRPSMPSKPCHIWVSSPVPTLQNPVTSGFLIFMDSFKTLSHLGDYHKSFVVQRKFGVKSM